MITVFNLSTGDRLTYSCSPNEAVIAAHAQSLGDYNTWNYTKRYGHLIEEGDVTVLCGNFSAYKDGRKIA